MRCQEVPTLIFIREKPFYWSELRSPPELGGGWWCVSERGAQIAWPLMRKESQGEFLHGTDIR